jgi:sugar lactone lactonase YvrE
MPLEVVTMKKVKKIYLLGTILIVLSMLLIGSAAASEHLQVEYAFNPGNLEFPEGITVDKVGNWYVSLGPPGFLGGGFGEIWQISPEGEAKRLVEFPGGPGPAGLAVDAPGNLYFAFIDGIYRYDKSGSLEKLQGTENILLANGLAFDKQGDLFVTDSITGNIWRVPLDGSGAAGVWYEDVDNLLKGCGDVPVGANGIAYRQGNFYVANTSLGMVVRIPQGVDGVSGEAQVVAGDPDCDPLNDELFSMDGIAFDVHGDLYAALVIQDKLVKIDLEDGSFTTLLTAADGLHNPASLAFGTGKGDRQQLLITNYAVIPRPGPSLGPAILSLGVDSPGQPLP